jgi:hypothetical protein
MDRWDATRSYTYYSHVGFVVHVAVPKLYQEATIATTQFYTYMAGSAYRWLGVETDLGWLDRNRFVLYKWFGENASWRQPYTFNTLSLTGVRTWTHVNPVAGRLHHMGVDLDIIDWIPTTIQIMCVLAVFTLITCHIVRFVQEMATMQDDITCTVLDGNTTTAIDESDNPVPAGDAEYITRQTLRTRCRGLPRRLHARSIDLRHDLCRLLGPETKVDTAENRLLVAGKARRVASSLKSQEKSFASLRRKDLTAIIESAVELYFIPTDDELQIQEQFDWNPEHIARKERYKHRMPPSL